MADLKPCPFCGGKAHLTKKNRIIVNGNAERECHIHCTVCNARAERVLYKSCVTTEMAHELAKALWNTRKPMELVVAELEAFARENDREPNAGFIDMCIEIVRGKEQP